MLGYLYYNVQYNTVLHIDRGVVASYVATA